MSSSYSSHKQQTLTLLRLLLRPVIRFCLKRGLKVQDISECVKLELAYSAGQELEKQSKKANASRISAMTGMHRRDIGRIDRGDYKLDENRDTLTRIITHWMTDPSFRTTARKPRVLSLSSGKSEFEALVKKAGTDLNPATILFELKRLQMVEETSRGLRLLAPNLIEKENKEEAYHIASEDMHGLITTVEHNTRANTDTPLHHLQTAFDSVRKRDIPELNRKLLEAGHKLHLQIRELIASYDQDTTPDPSYRGECTRVAFTSFTSTESNTPEGNKNADEE